MTEQLVEVAEAGLHLETEMLRDIGWEAGEPIRMIRDGTRINLEPSTRTTVHSQ